MLYLVDTGVLLRSVSVDDPARTNIQEAFRVLLRQGHQLVTSTQNIREFWNVTTRPASARGGYGQPLERAIGRVRYFGRFLQIVPESPLTHRIWLGLVEQYQVRGVQVHDAQLVAIMKSHGIANVVTLNQQDFRRYTDIQAFSPAELLAENRT